MDAAKRLGRNWPGRRIPPKNRWLCNHWHGRRIPPRNARRVHPIIIANITADKLKSIGINVDLQWTDVASMAGRPGAARAVGNIMRECRDPGIPCHRVVGSDGSLTGFAGGLERKRKLLALEGAR